MTFHHRTAFAPASIDRAARTVELIAATSTPVARRDAAGSYREVLIVTPEAVDLTRAAGLPLLDSHRNGALEDQLGIVRGLRFDNGRLIARVEFSERASAIFADVAGGLIRNVSVGYRPIKWVDGKTADGQRLRTVTRWELYEISLVPVPADPAATVRKDDDPMETLPDTTPATPPAFDTDAIAAIRALATAAGDPATGEGLIAIGATPDQARAAILAITAARAPRPMPPRIEVGTTFDGPDALRARVTDALMVRIDPSHKPSDAARPYCHRTLPDLAREFMRATNISTIGMSPDALVRASLTTTDFPAVFGDTANRVLRSAYQAAPDALRVIGRQTSARDFRAKTSVQFEDDLALKPVPEAAEYEYSGGFDGAESYRLGTHGRIVRMTRQMVINDDLGAFATMAQRAGQAAAEFEAQFKVDLLIANAGAGPTMAGGQPLFHSSRKNVAASGAALSATSLSAARLAMRRQVSLNGRPIAVAPKFLIVPPELETTAETVLAVIQATRTSDVNPFGGKLELLVEPRLTSATRWYLAADPALIEGLEYAYLQGSEGPQVETRAGWETDGIEVKVRLDYGAAFLDGRGWYMNPGA